MTQLDLFGDAAPLQRSGRPHGGDWAARLAAAHAESAVIAAHLPGALRFGTSSWGFPGWAGLVYGSKRPAGELAREGLREYACHPLLRTVGVDRSYYAPIPVDDLRRYADQLPDGFPCCLKGPASVTAPVVFGSRRDGQVALNPTFLSAERLMVELIEPCALAFRDYAGPFVLEFSPAPRDAAVDAGTFVEQLDAMLDELPREYRYAVELREARLFTPSYQRVIDRHGVAHVYNYWSAMPGLSAQAELRPVEQNPFALIRLLLKPGTWYEDQRERFKPFDRLVEIDTAMRRDVVSLAQASLGAGHDVFVLVNNKAEGSAPLTIRGLAEMAAATVMPR